MSGTIADRVEHVSGMLAIVTDETLRAPAFRAELRRRLQKIAIDLRQLEAEQARAGTP